VCLCWLWFSLLHPLPSAHPLKFCLYFLLVSANHAHPCPLTNPLPTTTYVSLPSSSAPSPFSLSFSLPLPYLRSLPIADRLVPTGKESSLSHHTLFKTSNPEHVAEPLHNERISLSCHRSSFTLLSFDSDFGQLLFYIKNSGSALFKYKNIGFLISLNDLRNNSTVILSF